MTELGTRIKSARREAGYKNVESLAVALGVGFSTVQRYEQGRTEPSITRLRQIAALTGKPLTFFLNGAEPDAIRGAVNGDEATA